MRHVRKGRLIYRKFCKICGAHLMTSHPRRPGVDVHAATVPTRPQEATPQLAAAATAFCNVDETILP